MAIETVDALEAYGNALLKNGIASSAVLGGDAAKEKAALPGMLNLNEFNAQLTLPVLHSRRCFFYRNHVCPSSYRFSIS